MKIEESPPADPTRKWALVIEVASLGVLAVYLWVLLNPDETERGMRGWAWAGRACYATASQLGRAGMACERHYAALTGNVL